MHTQDLYIRAYATNGSGTAYGEAIKIDHRNPYNLPIVEDQNVKYMVLPYDLEPGYMGYKLTDPRNTAYKSCADLVAYDYNDWELPTRRILELIYKKKNDIGGFTKSSYWTSTATGVVSLSWHYYYYVNFSNGTTDSDYGTKDVRPVRQY